MSGTFPLKYGIQLSGSFQSNPGGVSTQNGLDQSQNEIYNISQAAFRSLTGQTLTQAQVQVACRHSARATGG